MRIILVGGAGVQGMAAARTVCAGFDATDVVICSRDRARAEASAERLGARAAVADAGDPDSLARVFRRGDMVLNIAAPYFTYGAGVARAAITAGAHYADICDDWEATAEILALNGTAVRAGVHVVTGLGGAPGLDSMLAVKAMSVLDAVDEIMTAWPLSGGSSTDGPLSMVPYIHLMQCLVGPIRLVREGAFREEEPLQPVTFEHPLRGATTGYTVGSPEAITLQSGLPGVQTNLNLVLTGANEASQLRALAAMVRTNGISLIEAAALLKAAGADVGSTGEPSSEKRPSLLGWARGQKGGRPAIAVCELDHFPERTYTLAGVALGLAPRWLAEGRIGSPGARSIEHALGPDVYASALSQALGGGAVTLNPVWRWL